MRQVVLLVIWLGASGVLLVATVYVFRLISTSVPILRTMLGILSGLLAAVLGAISAAATHTGTSGAIVAAAALWAILLLAWLSNARVMPGRGAGALGRRRLKQLGPTAEPQTRRRSAGETGALALTMAASVIVLGTAVRLLISGLSKAPRPETWTLDLTGLVAITLLGLAATYWNWKSPRFGAGQLLFAAAASLVLQRPIGLLICGLFLGGSVLSYLSSRQRTGQELS